MIKYFVNENIRPKFLKVIGPDGNLIGNMEKSKALELAIENNLDLVLINQNSDPPLAKIINYSKFKYSLEKKEKDLRKKTRMAKNLLKEVNIRLNTGKWDLERIQRRIEEWLAENYKVKINLIVRGRENKYKISAVDFLKVFISSIKNSKIETEIKDSNKGLYVILVKS